jgi:hypothetical protein
MVIKPKRPSWTREVLNGELIAIPQRFDAF